MIGLAAVLLLWAAEQPQFNLPDGVVPRMHAIEMTIDPAKATFSGVARIDVALSATQSVIWVNGRDLVELEASIEWNGKTLPAKAAAAGGEFISITPEQPVGPGRATLTIRYQAPLSDKAVSGPYRREVEGEWYQYTVFTPIDARRAFPCFDEPRFKTPWEMAIRVRREHRAFANAPMISETDEPAGMKLVKFARTQPLPAEIVAFAVGPFDVWEGGTAGGKRTPVRVIAPKGQAERGKQAALATQEILPRLERYTGIPYPWDKLDHIALPQGAFGAVENPGLITYLSRSLLMAPAETDPLPLHSVRALQAHEIGHQWFGNLVTQSDWTDVWLSEGFATWFAARTMDDFEPPDRKHLGLIASREPIMVADDSKDTHPVRWPRHNREEMDNVYNRFEYQKGGAILLMLEGWLGEDPFQRGLRTYLTGHVMGNATTRDLESALPSAAAPVMEAFLNSTGVPVIGWQCEATKLVIENRSTLPIPICWTGGCAVVDQPKKEVSVASCPAYLNANGAGYYRTAWSAAQLEKLDISRLNGAERLTLVYDLRALHSKDAEPHLNTLTKDLQPEIARAARIALGLETEQPSQRRR